MKVFNLALPRLDWRQPWSWPRAWQYALFAGAACLGACLLSPWWLHSWQAWDDAHQAKLQWLAQQDEVDALRTQTAHMLHSPSPLLTSLADASSWTQLAQQHGLHLSEVGLDKPQHVAALRTLQMQQVPVHLSVQGSWEGWLQWLNEWPAAAPGVTVSSLEITADAKGGISAQLLAVAPQFISPETGFELASLQADDASSSDPFSTHQWADAQRAHASQQPSYARMVAPELLRPRDVLETFARDRLQYVGQISSGGVLHGLVKVLPPTGAKSEASLLSVHRVQVGSHLGHDFGKILAVEPQYLIVQELALSPAGEWQTREVRMPLHESAP